MNRHAPSGLIFQRHLLQCLIMVSTIVIDVKPVDFIFQPKFAEVERCPPKVWSELEGESSVKMD
jgi:hypothetical protein